jgi:hypothetical protein
MIEPAVTRRSFNCVSLFSLVTTIAATSPAGVACAQSATIGGDSTRRDVIKQKLPGEPERDLILVKVMYPPGTGSPSHLHPNGVMAFVCPDRSAPSSERNSSGPIAPGRPGGYNLVRPIRLPATLVHPQQRSSRFILTGAVLMKPI